MKKYKFTQNWFRPDDFIEILKPLDIKNEIHILEIGSFEGKSSVWFIDNLLVNKKSTITCIDPWSNFIQHKDSFNSYGKKDTEWDFEGKNTKNIFLNNIKETGKEDQVIIKDEFSHKILPELITQNKKYDFIYIDGNHTASFVLTDAVFSWYLLNNNGIIIFDDYKWQLNLDKTLRPKIAIDSFIENFQNYLVVIWDRYRKAIKKIK